MPRVAAAPVLFLLLPYCVTGTRDSDGSDASSSGSAELQWGAGFQGPLKSLKANSGNPIELRRSIRASGKCKRPEVPNLVVPGDKLDYDSGEGMLTQCIMGFSPSHSWITCIGSGSSYNWSPTVTCIQDCKTPEVANIILSNQLYYKDGFGMRPRCTEAYESSEDWITCERRGSANVWSAEVTCIQNCKAPDGANIVPSNKLYYKAGFGMSPRCTEGYEPSEYWIECERRGSANAWSAEVTCINLMDTRPTTATQVSKSSTEKDRLIVRTTTSKQLSGTTTETNRLIVRTTTSKQLSGTTTETGDTHVEDGSSFSIFSAIQLVQIGILLFIHGVVYFLSRTCKGGRETPLDARVYVNTVMN